ncbi:MAG TPA: hypothetical protein PLD85_11665 [Spirochaetota bacterium]|nr:hypothetical protein [Spirochaetota bacterium]
MLTKAQMNVILESIPINLAGKTWIKARSQQLSREPNFPRMVISELTSGIRKHYYADQIHKIKYFGQPADVIYGQIDSATFSIILASENREDVERGAEELQKWFLKESYYDLWNKHRVFFRGILAAGEIPSDYNDRNGKIIYRSNVDFAVDYEVSWKEDADGIRRFDLSLYKDEQATIRMLTTASNSYAMSIRIIKYQENEKMIG